MLTAAVGAAYKGQESEFDRQDRHGRQGCQSELERSRGAFTFKIAAWYKQGDRRHAGGLSPWTMITQKRQTPMQARAIDITGYWKTQSSGLQAEQELYVTVLDLIVILFHNTNDAIPSVR